MKEEEEEDGLGVSELGAGVLKKSALMITECPANS